MLFPTFEFAIFFIVVFFTAWGLRGNESRKWFLVAASYGFYGFWDYRFAFLLLQCSVSNFLLGLWLSKVNLDHHRTRKLIVGIAVGLNLAILGFFKYFDFFLASLNDVMFRAGLERELPILEIILPVGISFFTFQGISYIVDVYRQKIPANRKLVDVLLYVSFFPQLVAGPIVRAKDFLPQLASFPNPENIRAGFAFSLIGAGLVKKIFIAHYISQELVQPVFQDPLAYSTLDVMLGIYGYAVQIYCDFSAYSDMAIGFAALLGYHFEPNFDQPYRSKSLQEFWRRWHISLSSWLRDYLYIPLGGNRHGAVKTYRNLFLTMFLGGLWHGAAWKFVIWGVMHGSYLGIEKFFRDRFGSFTRGTVTGTIATVFIFHFVCLTWVFFASSSWANGMDYLRALGNLDQAPVLVNWFTVTLVFGVLWSQFWPKDWLNAFEDRLAVMPIPAQGIVLGALLILLSAIGPRGIAPFIYFQF